MNALPLSPIDYVFTGPGSQPITFAFSYSATIDPHILQHSLAETLNYFPVLRSQLKRISDTDFAFQMTDAGLTFDVVQTDLGFERSREIEQFITPVSSLEGKPLTRIVLTQTPQGSILAVSISHALVDGFSYFHFLSSWARICRGERIITPSLEREVLRSGLSHDARGIFSKEVYDRCGLFYGGGRRSVPMGRGKHERFFISDETIGSFLQETRHEHGSSLTDNDVITAHLWKNYAPLWDRDTGTPNSYMTCPVDFRRILGGFPKNYFGCALCFATASIDVTRLAGVSVGELAILVKNAVSRIRSEYITTSLSTLEDLRRQNGLAAMEEVHLRHMHHGMIVTNLTRMPLRDLEFGFGAPADFSVYSEVLGSAAILPADGGVEVLVVHPLDGN